MARYTLAVDRRYQKDKNNKGADFIGCVAFGKAAEFADKYLSKGMKIAINGRIQTGSYKNRDGQTVYTTDVIVEEHEFVESKTGSSGNRNDSSGYNDGFMNDGFLGIPDSAEDSGLPFN